MITSYIRFGCESHLQSTATGMMVPRFLTLDLHSYLKLVSVANYGAAYLAKVAQSKVLNKHLYSLTSWGADLPWTLREDDKPRIFQKKQRNLGEDNSWSFQLLEVY